MIVTDERARHGTWSIGNLNGLVYIDLDAGPKSAAVYIRESGRPSMRKIVRDWQMRLVWEACGKYAPNYSEPAK